jgi:hypothetical protein
LTLSDSTSTKKMTSKSINSVSRMKWLMEFLLLS